MLQLRNAVDAIMGAGRRLLNRRTAETGAADAAPRNYVDEREAERLGGVSAEDRAWETASRERNRETEARESSPPDGT